MPARKLNSEYYESGSAAKKREYLEIPKVGEQVNHRRVGKIKLNQKTNKKSLKSLALILSIFCMGLLITYRYNLINEKNLEAQSLKNKLNSSEGALISSQLEIEQNTDLTEIEAYAKQQLGMQKPDKNQTIYVDTSLNSKVETTSQSTTIINKIINAVKDFINKIF